MLPFLNDYIISKDIQILLAQSGDRRLLYDGVLSSQKHSPIRMYLRKPYSSLSPRNSASKAAAM